MARLIRIQIDVLEAWNDGQHVTIMVQEAIRSAKRRQIMVIHAGSEIREEDIDLTAQVVEDAIRSAVCRTLGIAQVLSF